MHKNGRLSGSFYNEYDQSASTVEVDQIVIEHSTLPNDELLYVIDSQQIDNVNFEDLPFVTVEPDYLYF